MADINLNPQSDYRQPYQVNPLYEKFPEPVRIPGAAHKNGTCGYMGSLCGHCHDQEATWHKRVAEAIAREYPPRPDENWMDYWRRVGGRWSDTWPEAALHAMKCAPAEVSA